MRPVIIFCFIYISLSGFNTAHGLTSQEKGTELAYKVEENYDYFGNFTSDVAIHISDGKGNEVVRSMKMDVLEAPGDGDKILMRFENPSDVKGTAFLFFSHKSKFDDVWVYIPDIRRVKRISSQTKGSDFMGTEFITEDMVRQEPEKFTYNWIGEKPCGNLMCDLVERFPVEKSSIYSKQVMWLDQDKLRFQKLDYYNKKGEFVKTLNFIGYKLYEGKFWRWDEHHMINHATGEVTRTEFKTWDYSVRLKPRQFTVNGLKNVR